MKMHPMRHPCWNLIVVMTLTAAAVAACSSAAPGAGAARPTAARAAAPRPALQPAPTPAPRPAGQAPAAQTAVARLESADDPKISGTATFIQLADAVRVVIDVAGVGKPGPHGLHLHENGKCERDPAGKQHYTTAGGHFNPTAAPHACPDATSHHAGDFGNIDIQADGSGHYVRVTALLALAGPSSPVGRALILHAGADDCKTQPAGGSGDRLACGVVEAAAGQGH
jgi:Cu-Zn family superoxide dismutase